MRVGEIAVLGAREAARRHCSGELVACVQLLILWGAALVLSTLDFGDATSNATASDISAALMWLGNLWWLWQQAFRSFAHKALPGALPLERSVVVANAGFIFHRNNEFMFLMLGETILQIIIALSPGDVAAPADDGADPLFNVSVATASLGFVIAVCMMFSFRSMVRGQQAAAEATNTSLTKQTSETEGLMDIVAATQGFGPRRVAAESEALMGVVGASPANESAAAKAAGRSTSGSPHREGEKPSGAPQALPAAEGVPPQGVPAAGASVRGPSEAVRVGPAAHGVGGADPQRRLSQGQADTLAVRKSSLMKRMIDTRALDVRFEGKATGIVLTMHLYNVLTSFMWQTKALSVMLVGVGVKLAIYNPTASARAHFATAQRIQMGVPLALVFGVQLCRTVFVSQRHHYSCETIREHPIHVCVVLTRLALLLATGLIALQPLEPLPMMAELSVLSLAQCVFMQLHDAKFPIRSTQGHPMRELPNALLALQQRRRRAEEQATSGNGSDAQRSGLYRV
jgi:hypothetical protein